MTDGPGTGPFPPATERVLAGYCHDLNGQLTNAFGWLSLMGPAVAATEGPTEHLQASLERMESLLRELRWLVRDPNPAADPTSLADLLDAWESALRQHPHFHDVAIERLAPVDLPAVAIDFASALRVLLLAADAAAGGADVAALSVRVEPAARTVRIVFPGSGEPSTEAPDTRGAGGRVGSRGGLEAEARASGLGVEWSDDSVGIVLPAVG
jgi:hypothetical protein